MCVSVTCQCQDIFCRVLSTRVRAVRAETSWERGGWGGWAGRRGETDASSKRRGFRHPKLEAARAARPPPPARAAPWSRGDISKLKRRDCARKVRGVRGRRVSCAGPVSPAILSTYFYRTAGKRVKANRIDRSGRRACTISEPSYCWGALASGPDLSTADPAGTPSVHAAAHTVLTATPPMSRSCERRPARCAMLHAYQDTASKIALRANHSTSRHCPLPVRGGFTTS